MNTKTSLAKKILLGTAYAIAIAILLLAACLQIFSPTKVIDVFGVQAYLVSYTGSMEPELNYNDLIVIKKYDFYKLKKGDIITFMGKTTDGKVIPITHKVNDIRDNANGSREIQTKGTNLSKPDLIQVTIDGANGTNKYIGKLAFKSEYFGNLFAYLKDWRGILALGINAVCITLIYIMFSKKPSTAYTVLIDY